MIKTEDFLTFLFGDASTEIDSIEKFKQKFESSFVSAAALEDSKTPEFQKFLPKAVGNVAGKSMTNLKKRLAELEIELTPDEIKGKPLEDAIDIALTKAVSTVKSKFSDYDTKLTAHETDAVKDWTKKYGILESKYNDLNSLHSGLKSTYEKEVEDHKTQLATERIANLKNRYHDKVIKFKTGIKDVEKTGYFANVEKSVKLALNDKGDDIEVLDLSGNRIPNPKQAGSWKTYSDILEEQGVKDGVWAINESTRRMNEKVSTFAMHQQENITTPANGDNKDRKVSSRVKLPM